ncbi:S9 family peptidase [Aegicerativicinus sediminis]|uniref:S9 family peptidase n=1 Tax=Aegicerativicinus sediminis TaxID=2893202 RepID=UPI001E4F85A2|nr:S9 family peptidase [Aegicerativicinus sediminis]
MKKFRLAPTVILFTLLFFSVPNFQKIQAQSSILTLDHFDVLVDLGNPKISPDGNNILLLSRKADFEDNKYINTLWLVDINTREKKALTHDRPSINSPEWSTDGKSITFLSAGKNKKPQIFKMPLQGGEALQVTNSKVGIMDYKMSPDGHLFAFIEKDSIIEKSGVEKHNKSFEVGYDWYLAEEEPRPTNIWICSENGDNKIKLTSGELGESINAGSLQWSSDSKKLVFTVKPKPHSSEFLKNSLQLIDIETKETTVLDKGPGVPSNPSFSKDGSLVLYSKAVGPEPGFNPNGIFSADLMGSGSKYISKDIDRNLRDHVWFRDQSFLTGASDGTKVSLWRGNLSGDLKKIDTKGILPSLGNIDIGPADQIVFIGSTSQKASELYYMKTPNSTPIKLSSFNDAISNLKLGKVSSINWKGEDDFYEDGVLTYPPDFTDGKKYPLVLYIHGGPMGASLETFNFFAQAFASNGWIVFQPNYRGSNNLGKAYQTSVINDAGEGPGKDVMTGIEAIKKMGIIDDGQMAVSGWSYGGYMTVWLTSHYQGWKSAVAGAAVTDWFDWYNMADMNIWAGYGLGGSPWLNDNAENYRKQSPITYAHQIKTPTLILSNTLDQRVTVTQSYKLFHNLKDNGTETKFVAYPIPGHFPADPVHRKDVYKRWTQWIKDHF